MSNRPVAMTPTKTSRTSRRKLPTTLIVTLIPVCVALNIVGGYIASALRLPVYLDMIGTAISAIVLGPWVGALVGVLTNAGSALISGPVSLPFALVNVVGALIWGYGVRSWGLGRTIPRFFLLNVIVAIACTIVAAPIIVLVFGGATGNGADALTGTFLAVGQNLVGSVFSSNILTSLADKIIGGFVALAVIEALPKSLTADIDIVKATPLKGILLAVAGVIVGVLIVVVFLAINASAGLDRRSTPDRGGRCHQRPAREEIMTEPIIRFDNVRYRYAGSEEAALDGIDLSILPGEYVAILGLNGAGKTTLALTINGVIPTMLGGTLEGSVTVSGLDVESYAVREMAKIVGIVFDNPEFQMSQMSVAEEVALGLENAGVPYEEMIEIIPDTLALVGLAGYEERSPLGLSGGQQQRLAIAAVLAMKPQILIMDEPTSNLDPVGKKEVFDIAATLNREAGMTVVVIEHEVEVMAAYADRVVVINAGRVVMNGPPGEVLSQVQALADLGLRAPEAAVLADTLRARGDWTGSIPTMTEPAVVAVRQMIGAGHV